MFSDRTKAALLAGEVLRGEFAPSGSQDATPATLTWEAERGATLELIGRTSGWPADAGRYRHTIHGVIDGGQALTLRHAGVRRRALGEAVTLGATTLVLGEHVDESVRWHSASYETTNLSEWVAYMGWQQPPARGEEPGYGIGWEPATPQKFTLPRAQATLGARAEFAPVGYVPSWSMSTSQRLHVTLRRPAGMDQLHTRYAMPLVSFTAFAADRPDSVIVERLASAEHPHGVEVWRRGRHLQPREWNPTDGYLFHASQLRRLPAALRRWWKLNGEIWPALGMFAEHISEDNAYSPARFLTLHTAMEAYCRVRFGKKDFRFMRDYANVSSDIHGCTNAAIALIGATRDYVAHLTKQRYSTETIEDTMFDSTRRANALMQACLLRELGFGPRQTERLLCKYQEPWPLPPFERRD